MHFDLTEDQQLLQKAVCDFLTNECPVPMTLRAHEDASVDHALWNSLMAIGLGKICVPECHGGMGLKLLDLAIIAEVVGRFAAPGRFLSHALATHALVMSENDPMQAKWLPKLSSGQALATIALGESNDRWLADEWSIDARSGLNGSKYYVPHADEADIMIVGLEGGALALVETGAPGISIVPANAIDAGRPLFEVRFSDTPFSLLSASGARLCDAALVLLTADAFGGATHCVTSSVAYAKDREQFNRPIGMFQGLKHQLADMALEVEPSVGLFWYAAFMHDDCPDAASAPIALAKAHITDLYAQVSRRMIEAHGGIGYTWEFAAHVWLKRALFNRAFMGLPQRHRARYADLQGW